MRALGDQPGAFFVEEYEEEWRRLQLPVLRQTVVRAVISLVSEQGGGRYHHTMVGDDAETRGQGDRVTGRGGGRRLSIRAQAFYIVLACFAPEGFYADAHAAG